MRLCTASKLAVNSLFSRHLILFVLSQKKGHAHVKSMKRRKKLYLRSALSASHHDSLLQHVFAASIMLLLLLLLRLQMNQLPKNFAH